MGLRVHQHARLIPSQPTSEALKVTLRDDLARDIPRSRRAEQV
jgi:hypothetical protein